MPGSKRSIAICTEWLLRDIIYLNVACGTVIHVAYKIRGVGRVEFHRLVWQLQKNNGRIWDLIKISEHTLNTIIRKRAVLKLALEAHRNEVSATS